MFWAGSRVARAAGELGRVSGRAGWMHASEHGCSWMINEVNGPGLLQNMLTAEQQLYYLWQGQVAGKADFPGTTCTLRLSVTVKSSSVGVCACRFCFCLLLSELPKLRITVPHNSCEIPGSRPALRDAVGELLDTRELSPFKFAAARLYRKKVYS